MKKLIALPFRFAAILLGFALFLGALPVAITIIGIPVAIGMVFMAGIVIRWALGMPIDRKEAHALI